MRNETTNDPMNEVPEKQAPSCFFLSFLEKLRPILTFISSSRHFGFRHFPNSPPLLSRQHTTFCPSQPIPKIDDMARQLRFSLFPKKLAALTHTAISEYLAR